MGLASGGGRCQREHAGDYTLSKAAVIKFGDLKQHKFILSAGRWWFIPLVPALNQRQADLVYRVSSWTIRATHRNTVSNKQANKQINKHYKCILSKAWWPEAGDQGV